MSSTAPRPKVIAHRGASAHAPENSLAAFDLAIRMGADVLELDVRLTADCVPVVLHDRSLLRTAGDVRSIGKLTVAQLDELAPGARPVLLGEVLARYGGATRYLVDLKDPSGAVERRTVELVARHGVGDRAQVQTFSRRGLQRVRDADPGLSLAQLYPPFTPSALVRRDLRRVARFAQAVGPEAASVDQALVGAAHALGLQVQPYTVNEPNEIARLLDLGVDGVITDVPGAVRAAVDGRPALPAAA